MRGRLSLAILFAAALTFHAGWVRPADAEDVAKLRKEHLIVGALGTAFARCPAGDECVNVHQVPDPALLHRRSWSGVGQPRVGAISVITRTLNALPRTIPTIPRDDAPPPLPLAAR